VSIPCHNDNRRTHSALCFLSSLLAGLLQNLQLNLCYIATAIASYPPFTAHAAALQLDASLLRSLVQLLTLHAAAEVLQLPAIQRCDEPNGLPLDWALVSHVMGTLMSDVLSRTFQEQQAVTNSVDGSHASRLLQTAAQLCAAALASPPNGVIGDIPASLCGSLLVLLSLACREHGRAILQQQQGWQQGTQRCPSCLQGSDAAALHAEVAALLHREPQPGDGLALAQAAATRSCAYLRCANLAGEGGPAAGQGTGTQRCSKCRVAWYCGTTCSHADWRAGHRRMCRALGAARLAEQESAGVKC
jgi:hypothetical protein